MAYIHDTSRCKVSKTNCVEMQGIKLKHSCSTAVFYNKADCHKLSYPSERKPENQYCVGSIETGRACYCVQWDNIYMWRGTIDVMMRFGTGIPV